MYTKHWHDRPLGGCDEEMMGRAPATRLSGGRIAPRTAFVMPGGATLGAVQVGMLRALVGAGIQPDLVVATSVGAMNASVFITDRTPAGVEHLGQLWTRAPRAQIFPFTPLAVARSVVRRQGHLLSNDGLRAWISEHLRFERLEDAPVPFHVMATDLRHRQAVTLSTGDALDALMASTALPGVFPPITIGGRQLVDGGATADVPVPQACALGAERVIVLPTVGGPPPPEEQRGAAQWRGRLHRWLDHTFGQPAEAAAPAPDDAGPVEVHVLPAPPSRDVNPFSFRNAGRLIDESTALVQDWLDGDGAGLLDPGSTTIHVR